MHWMLILVLNHFCGGPKGKNPGFFTKLSEVKKARLSPVVSQLSSILMFSTYDKEMWGIRAVFTHIVNMVCTVWKGKYLSNTLYIIHKCLHTNGSQFLKCSNANETSYYFTHKKTAQKVSFLTYDLTKVFRTLANVDYVAKHFIKPSLILCYILLQIHFSPFPYASS